MTMLNDEQASRISELITSIERRTDAELVTVLARRSDEYVYIPTLFAALAALCFPWILVLTSWWLDTQEVLTAQLLVFVVLAGGLRWPPIMMKLVPKSVRFDRAAKMARRQFLEQNLHHTQGDTGLLIFVSEAEHYVEILADRGISEHVPDDRWREIVDTFVGRVIAQLAGISRLLAAETYVVGMRPAVAVTLVELGMYLPETRTALSLTHALSQLRRG